MSHSHSAFRERLQAALGDEFTVGEPLGEGGFAVVFRARDNALNRDVAVKVMDMSLAPARTLVERFVREAQTVARLEHPNIVPIYKVGGRGDVLYIIMRCVDGPSLRELLAAETRLPVEDAARVARQIADALAYAHAQGIVHRDVKPDNVLLDKSGHVLVTDFGIAKAAAQAKGSGGAGPLTTEGMILGTPHYMSPEQAAGETLDPRSDLYSLGVVLYQMLSGDPPFDGDDASTVLSKHLTASPTPIRSVRPDVSKELAALVDRLLAKSPSRRYASAADVSRALVEAVPTAAHDRLHARMPPKRRTGKSADRAGGTPRGSRGSRTGRRVFIGALALVAIAVAGAFTASAATSKAPAVTAQAPSIPDSVVAALRTIGALERGERLQVVFVPFGRTLRDALLLTDRNMVRVTPRGARRYPAQTVRPGDLRTFHHFGLRRGLRTGVVVARRGGRADTLYADLGLRELYEMRHFLLRLGG